MAHQVQLEKAKYRQWAKACLGLGYLKEGLAPFCQDIVKQQHKDILDNIQQTKSLPPNMICRTCHLKTLKPDHVNVRNNVCPYGQAYCNCCFPKGKVACPNNICGTIYDYIIKSHASTPPSINWRNTDSQLWSSDPWSIAKCFINAPGYDQKTTAADTDCLGLLHVIINNQYFHNHITCNLTRASIFSKVRNHRNEIFHSGSQELEEATADTYIDDMINVLQDSKELVNQTDARRAVEKLQELKNKDLIITSESHEELLKQVREDLMHELDELKSTASTKEEVEELDRKISNIEKLLKQTRDETESTKELLNQTKDEMAKSKQSTEELLKKTRDEMEKTTNATKEKCEGNRRNIETLMSVQEEIKKRLPAEDYPAQKLLEFEKAKIEWRNKMIKEYKKTVLKVPAIPLLPDEPCEFSKLYVRPKIVSAVKDENREIKEIEINSMSKIFSKNGEPLKSIYVVGDAGTGKSSFCKYLVNCWCMAHSGGQIVEEEFDGVKEMKKFEFLFFVSLRHNQSIDNVHEMLKNQYDIDILCTLIEKESARMIILLDGLDEWSSEYKTYNQFQTMGLPKHDVYKNYTIVTTSRPWKIHTLRINAIEIQILLKLKGFDDNGESEMVKRTVSNINFRKGESKNIDDCKRKLKEMSLRNLKEIPIMLQQLICLWFDDKLDKTSRCFVYIGMLELFFSWNDDKDAGTSSGIVGGGSQTLEFPECLADKEILDLNSHLIYETSRLAFETLFNCSKDKSLTFDISVYRKLKISDDVRKDCLKIGIMTEDRCPSLRVSERPKSMFSFIHKSVQEFLAAINITINFRTKMNLSVRLEKEDLEKIGFKFINGIFQKCSTVNGILEQSNVIIMLCGLEPRLATHVSRYIYDIVKGDALVQSYRMTVATDHDILSPFASRKLGRYRCIRDIHRLILDAIVECNTSHVEKSITFHIADLIIEDRNKYCDIVCSSIDQQQIETDCVHSISINYINTSNVRVARYLPKFQHLEKIQIYQRLRLSSTKDGAHEIDEANDSVVEAIKINASTLKSLSLEDTFDTGKLNTLCEKIVSILSRMINLVAIKMTSITMSHDDTTRFFEFLEESKYLEEIEIDIECECKLQHDVDFSNNQQLQYLNLHVKSTEIINSASSNINRTNYLKIFESIGNCDKLKELILYLEYNRARSFHTSITEKLVSVLPLLHKISKLELGWFKLTENIIKVASEMKILKIIDLYGVAMSLTTWRKFVNNLPSIPHTVDVRLFPCYITGDGEEFNDDRLPLLLGGGGKLSDAIQHVKDQQKLFIVKDDDVNFFKFSTKVSKGKDT